MFGKDLLRSVFQKGIITAVIAVLVPTSSVVAEPSLGTMGDSAVKDLASVTAAPSITRFIGRTLAFEASAYTASSEETDGSPCIAASRANICDPANFNTIATNDLPIGTIVLVNGEAKVVRDRMNERYTGKNVLDILMQSKADARQWGRRQITVSVLD